MSQGFESSPLKVWSDGEAVFFFMDFNDGDLEMFLDMGDNLSMCKPDMEDNR